MSSTWMLSNVSNEVASNEVGATGHSMDTAHPITMECTVFCSIRYTHKEWPFLSPLLEPPERVSHIPESDSWKRAVHIPLVRRAEESVRHSETRRDEKYDSLVHSYVPKCILSNGGIPIDNILPYFLLSQ